MERDRRHKKMILFLSDQNPLWGQIQKLEIESGSAIAALVADEKTGFKPSKVCDLLGISSVALSDWRQANQGKQFGFAAGLRRLSGLLQEYSLNEPRRDRDHTERFRTTTLELKRLIDEYESDWQLGESGLKLYQAARLILRMSMADAQLALDTVFYRGTPLLPSAYYDSEEQARRHIGAVNGYYTGWMKRFEKWMRCSVHVRYPMEVDKRWFIRAKMNLPMYYPTAEDVKAAKKLGRKYPYWEYDGFVYVSPVNLYWCFDKRDNARHDFFHIITGRREDMNVNNGLHSAFSGFVGQYLTSHQDRRQLIVGGNFVLEAADVDESDDYIGANTPENFMWSKPNVVHGESATPEAERASEVYSLLRLSDDTDSREPPTTF